MTVNKVLEGFKKEHFLYFLAYKHHKTHKGNKLNFKLHPYQRQIYKDKSENMIIIKSTQNGISEYLLVRAMAHAIKGMNVFYVLPTFELVKRFVDERFTKSVQNSTYYKGLLRFAKEEMGVKQTESVRSKDIGQGNIAFVNSGSASGFTEYPADEVIIDELDKCDPDNIEMAWERMSASEYRWQIKISNPTFKQMGIDIEYGKTDKLEWFVKCPNGHDIRPDWFKHVVEQIDDGRYVIRDSKWNWDSNRDISLICDKCGKPVDRRSKGVWVSTGTGKIRGYRLTKLFTGTVSIIEILDRFNKGLVNDTIMQRFYNADLGEAFTASGSKIDRDMLLACVGDYIHGIDDGLVIAGIDVGKKYHFVIKKMLPDGSLKTLCIDNVFDTEELVRILKEYNVKAGVIDAGPETREAKKISKRFNMMFLCYFGNVKTDKIDLINKIITVQRTPALDAVKEMVLTKKVMYGRNIIADEDFLQQMTCSVRVYNKDKRFGSQVGAYEWVEGNAPDHYFLASAYCLIAMRLVVLLRDRK